MSKLPGARHPGPRRRWGPLGTLAVIAAGNYYVFDRLRRSLQWQPSQ